MGNTPRTDAKVNGLRGVDMEWSMAGLGQTERVFVDVEFARELERESDRRLEDHNTQQRVAIKMQEQRDAAILLLRRVMAMTGEDCDKIADDVYSFLQPNEEHNPQGLTP